MTEESTPENQSSNITQSESPAWYIDETTPGMGSRPSWLPEKYQRLSDVEKARGELEKKLGGFTGAPEKYDIGALEIDESDPTLNAIMEVGKKHNMNQEIFQEVVGRLMSMQETQDQMHIEDEVKKLGKDGERMLTEYKNWTRDYLKPEEQEIAKEWVKSAEDLQVFNRIMAHTHMSQVPTNENMNMANQFEGVKSLRNELAKNLDKFNNDKAYAKDWQARMGRAVRRDPNS